MPPPKKPSSLPMWPPLPPPLTAFPVAGPSPLLVPPTPPAGGVCYIGYVERFEPLFTSSGAVIGFRGKLRILKEIPPPAFPRRTNLFPFTVASPTPAASFFGFYWYLYYYKHYAQSNGYHATGLWTKPLSPYIFIIVDAHGRMRYGSLLW
jgi:hypothetical protein